MLRAIIGKDLRLLRGYLRGAIVATIGCYISCAISVCWFTGYQEDNWRTTPVQSFVTLRGGSSLGFPVTAFFSVLLAGSVFTLERADRSAEFLAWLPPTRVQHLVSKLGVVFGATSLMLCVHLAAIAASDQLLPYVQTTNYPLTDGEGIPTAVAFTSVVLSMIGGAIATSAWLKSNGVPILCGLLTPLLTGALVSSAAYLLDIPADGGQVSNRFYVASALLGIALTFCGAHWYVERVEP